MSDCQSGTNVWPENESHTEGCANDTKVTCPVFWCAYVGNNGTSNANIATGYAIDCTKIEKELGWKPQVSFEQGMKDTIAWYKEHPDWVASIRSGAYMHYLKRQYGELRR